VSDVTIRPASVEDDAALAGIDRPNAAARRVYDACGFVVEGVLREEFLLDGRYVDDVFMARDLTTSEGAT